VRKTGLYGFTGEIFINEGEDQEKGQDILLCPLGITYLRILFFLGVTNENYCNRKSLLVLNLYLWRDCVGKP